MAQTYKVLGQVKPGDTNLTTLYTVPSATSAVVSTLVVCNLAAAAKSFRIAVRPAGASIDDKHFLAYDVVIAANDSTCLTLGLTLAATDVLSVRSSAANDLSFNAFGSEIT
jgi:hypothetical protein